MSSVGIHVRASRRTVVALLSVLVAIASALVVANLTPATAQDTAPLVTVKDVLDEDLIGEFRLRGKATQRIDHDEYLFKDATGSIKIDVNTTDASANIPLNTRVELVGEEESEGVRVESWILIGSGVPTEKCGGLTPTIVGTDGPDLLIGTEGQDVILAKGGADIVIAQGGADVVCGGGGIDLISGDGGRDQLFGQGSNDVLVGGRKDDVCDGGNGTDLADCETVRNVP